MNKESYLNYVMLTKPKEEWSSLVFQYIIDNGIKNWREGFDFIANADHDYTETTPFYYVYWLVANDYVPAEWGIELIETNSDNKHAKDVASWLVSEDKVTLDWYKKIWNDGIEYLN